MGRETHTGALRVTRGRCHATRQVRHATAGKNATTARTLQAGQIETSSGVIDSCVAIVAEVCTTTRIG